MTGASTRAGSGSFRLLLSAYGVSQLGNWLFRTGVIFHAYNQNGGSNTLLSAAIVLVYLPILLGSRLLAPLADRLDTRRTLIGLDVLRAAVLVVLLAVVWTGTDITTAATLGVMGFLSLLTPFFVASQTAYMRRLLPREQLPSALAAVGKVEWLTFIVGSAAAPLLLHVIDLPTLILLDIATFVISALLLIRLVPAPPIADLGGPGDAGARTRRLTRASTVLLFGVLALNAGAGLINVYPNVVARDFLGNGTVWLSVINLANGVGGVLGAVIAGRVVQRRGLRPGVLAAAVVAVSLVGMTVVSTAWVAVLASSMMLLAGQVFAVTVQSRILANEPVGVAGRISGYFTLATFAGVTVSTVMFLGVTSLGPLPTTFRMLLVLAAALAAVSVVVGAVAVRRHGNHAPGSEPALSPSTGRA